MSQLQAISDSREVGVMEKLILRPTCGEVDIGKQDDVGGHEGDELSNANLLFEVHMDQVLCSEAAVGAGVQVHEPGAKAAQKPVDKKVPRGARQGLPAIEQKLLLRCLNISSLHRPQKDDKAANLLS